MNVYCQLAKDTIENYLEKGEIIKPSTDLPQEFLEKKAGVFVTIKKDGELRGCIGTYLPTQKNIAEEIIYNAIAVAAEDYRFGPVSKEELPHLSYIVYILGELELIKDIKELDPKKYGIIVKTANRTGLLLPGLEGIDATKEQVSIACQKGGIHPEKEKITIYRFTVEKYAQ